MEIQHIGTLHYIRAVDTSEGKVWTKHITVGDRPLAKVTWPKDGQRFTEDDEASTRRFTEDDEASKNSSRSGVRRWCPESSGCFGQCEGDGWKRRSPSKLVEGRHWGLPHITKPEGSEDRSEPYSQRLWQEPSGAAGDSRVANDEGGATRSLSKTTSEGSRRARNMWSE